MDRTSRDRATEATYDLAHCDRLKMQNFHGDIAALVGVVDKIDDVLCSIHKYKRTDATEKICEILADFDK